MSAGPQGGATAPAATGFALRTAGLQDALGIEAIVVARWGAREIVSRGALHDALGANAVVAEDDGGVVGLATWVADGDEAELLTLDALRQGQGIGGALVEAVADAAAHGGARRLVLSTSNDNVHALAFYQRRGFRITAVLPGAIDRARARKPAIPLVGEHGIEIHDALVLVRPLGAGPLGAGQLGAGQLGAGQLGPLGPLGRAPSCGDPVE